MYKIIGIGTHDDLPEMLTQRRSINSTGDCDYVFQNKVVIT